VKYVAESDENTMRRTAGWGYYVLVPLVVCVLGHPDVFALTGSTGPGGSNAQAVHALGYEGQNINIGFISIDNLLVTHEAFYEKDLNGLPTGQQHAFVHDTLGFGINATTHDTQMAGIIVSNGGQNEPYQIGVAPKANLHNVRVTSGGSITTDSIQKALTELITVYNCKVIVTGFAFPLSSVVADGQSIWSKIYDYYAQTHDVVFANAAGNFEARVNVFGDAYNGITTGGLFENADHVYQQVGAINGSGSNSGPTIDGRKKPEIVCPSQNQWTPKADNNSSWGYPPSYYHDRGQTSWAVPHTAGVAAILLSYANISPETMDGRNEVIRAVIVNSTFPNIRNKSGQLTYPALPENVWNTDRGYGRLDALRAFELLLSPKVLPSSTISSNKGWAYQSLSPGQQQSYTLSASKNSRFVITLTWNRKVVWTDKKTGFPPKNNGVIDDGELEAFFADLDLEIYEPNSLNPLVSEISSIDNLEKVDRRLKKTGNYQIKVINKSDLESSAYGMAFELLEPLEGDFNTDYVVDTTDLTLLAEYWLADNCADTGQLCYGFDLDASGKIDLAEMAALSAGWMTTDPRYYSN
jgi:hypothetical protein